jgi:neopullulanase
MRLRVFALMFVSTFSALAQSPKIEKIDPPNWWLHMPALMLLIKGENLTGAHFTCSDRHVKIQKTEFSANGHFAKVWLAASPFHPETVRIDVETVGGHASTTYTFSNRRGLSDGFAGFSARDVMYLIMTDRFADGDTTNDGPDHAEELLKARGWHGGDLRGIKQHLDYLQALGITTVWITPVYQNHGAQSYHGYGATDMYAVDEHFGTLADLKELADALHSRHMKLVLDTVPNHVGRTHPWVEDSPDPAWFHGTLAHHTTAQTNFAPLIDPHASLRSQRAVTEGWFVNALPDLNQENPAVAQYLIQNAIWWIEEAGVDGLRIDTFPFVSREFWHDFHAEIHSLYPQLTTVGEVFERDAIITSSFAGGVTRSGVDTGLDTPFDFPTYFAIRDVFLKDAPISNLAEVLRMDNLYPHPERLVPFLGNHDTPRFLDDPAATPTKLTLAFTILTTMRGMPQIYSGDEIAMRGGRDPDNRHDFPGGFAISQPDAFHQQGRSSEQQQVFAALQNLLAIRQAHPALQSGEEQVLHADNNLLVFVRTIEMPGHALQRILIAVNKGPHAESVQLSTDGTALEGTQSSSTLLGEPNAISVNVREVALHVAPESAAMAELK